MAKERQNPDTMVSIASKILSERFGDKVCLHVGKIFSRGSIVVRCHVVGTSEDIPATFIVKKVKEDGIGYNPDSSDIPNAAHELFNDWAAVQFLSEIPSDPPLAPLFYGGDRKAGLIILEDLGEGDGLNTIDVLHGDDPVVAEKALIEHVSLIGQLHAATIGRSEEYQRFRNVLGPPPSPKALYRDPWSDARGHRIQTSEVYEAIKLYHATFLAVGIRPREGVEDEIEFISATVEGNPGPFLAYCKGDQNLAGDYIRCGSKPRLFDFNAGGFRHALIEGMPGRMTWGCMMRLPALILPRMERAYQAKLAQGCSDAVNDAVFHRAMVEAGARWTIFHVVHRLSDALERDRQRGPTTLRQQVVAWMKAFADLSEEFGHIQALGKSARDMATRLSTIWSPEVIHLPYYPAFQ